MDATSLARLHKLNSAFTPSSPVNNQDLFAGRLEHLQKIFSAIPQRGTHVVMFGERGVGKTSLANVVGQVISGSSEYLLAKVTCDAGDNFSSIWRKALKEINYTTHRRGVGFTAEAQAQVQALSEMFPDVANPDDVRRVLEPISQGRSVVIVLDEYDRIEDRLTSTLISDTIKVLSDTGVGATLLLIGVADSVGELVDGHQSIERALVQIPMQRMSNEEIGQIIAKGMALLETRIDPDAKSKIVELSQGLPYVAHLLGLHSCNAAIQANSTRIEVEFVKIGIAHALDSWQESIKRTYYYATKSHQPGNIYPEVLLACALAETDELGYFTAASVRGPLRHVTGRDYEIPNYANHLKQFCAEDRNSVLSREGEPRRWRYRFTSPLMRPYVKMKGHSDGKLS